MYNVFLNSFSKFAESHFARKIYVARKLRDVNLGFTEIPTGLKNIIIHTHQAGIETIPILNSHILGYQPLEVLENHKDPFGRYIISIALCEDMKIISSDSDLDLYSNEIRIWNE